MMLQNLGSGYVLCVVVSEGCPSCPYGVLAVYRIATQRHWPLLVLTADAKDGQQLLSQYGLTVSTPDGGSDWPLPQILLWDGSRWHFLEYGVVFSEEGPDIDTTARALSTLIDEVLTGKTNGDKRRQEALKEIEESAEALRRYLEESERRGREYIL